MEGYDLQDTLVNIDYAASFGLSQLVNNIKEAKVLHRPSGEFVIITAQMDNTGVHTAIKEMVDEKFPNCAGVYFVSGGQESIIQKKAASIKRLRLTSFTDNNVKILAGIRELLPEMTLYHMTGNGRKKY